MISADEEMLVNALVAAADKVLDDKTRMQKFWRGGYEALVTHSIEGSRRWIGAKVLAAIGALLFGAGLYLLGRFGDRL
jgi:NAD(P)H-hydrate repair Nnr-like enzyme with NAD(P)H-hydrate dehydratase domain